MKKQINFEDPIVIDLLDQTAVMLGMGTLPENQGRPYDSDIDDKIYYEMIEREKNVW